MAVPMAEHVIVRKCSIPRVPLNTKFEIAVPVFCRNRLLDLSRCHVVEEDLLDFGLTT